MHQDIWDKKVIIARQELNVGKRGMRRGHAGTKGCENIANELAKIKRTIYNVLNIKKKKLS